MALTYEERAELVNEIADEIRDLRRARKGSRGLFAWFFGLRNPVKIMLASGILITGVMLSTPHGRGDLVHITRNVETMLRAVTTVIVGYTTIVATALRSSRETVKMFHVAKSMAEDASNVLAVARNTKSFRYMVPNANANTKILKNVATILKNYTGPSNGNGTKIRTNANNPELTFAEFTAPWHSYMKNISDTYIAALNDPDLKPGQMLDLRASLFKVVEAFKKFEDHFHFFHPSPSRSPARLAP